MPTKPKNAGLDFPVTKQAYCPGYIDKHGIWNNGFNCPQLSTEPRTYCCGHDRHRYCCPVPDDYTDDSGDTTPGIGESVEHWYNNVPLVAGIGTAAFLFILLVICCCCCYVCKCCYVNQRRRKRKDTHHPFQYVCDEPPPYYPGSTEIMLSCSNLKEASPLNNSCTVFKNEKFFELIKDGSNNSNAKKQDASVALQTPPDTPTPLPLNLSFSSFMQAWSIPPTPGEVGAVGGSPEGIQLCRLPTINSPSCSENDSAILLTSSMGSSATSSRNEVSRYSTDVTTPSTNRSYSTSDFSSTVLSTSLPSSDFCSACKICDTVPLSTDGGARPKYTTHRVVPTEYVTSL